MSVRKKTNNRLNLYRQCYICGKWIWTTADTAWVRQLYNVGGKKQKTCYFCSSGCLQASYVHIGYYDGKAKQRQAEKEASRDVKEKNKRYYDAHAEQERERSRARYWADREEARKTNKFNREKRKLLYADAPSG